LELVSRKYNSVAIAGPLMTMDVPDRVQVIGIPARVTKTIEEQS
jgi:acetyltransferase-like isoleucine patch superfamily enzyme